MDQHCGSIGLTCDPQRDSLSDPVSSYEHRALSPSLGGNEELSQIKQRPPHPAPASRSALSSGSYHCCFTKKNAKEDVLECDWFARVLGVSPLLPSVKGSQCPHHSSLSCMLQGPHGSGHAGCNDQDRGQAGEGRRGRNPAPPQLGLRPLCGPGSWPSVSGLRLPLPALPLLLSITVFLVVNSWHVRLRQLQNQLHRLTEGRGRAIPAETTFM